MTTGQVPDRLVRGYPVGGPRWWDDNLLRPRPTARTYPPVGNPPEEIGVCPECGAYYLPELGCIDPRHASVGAGARRSRA